MTHYSDSAVQSGSPNAASSTYTGATERRSEPRRKVELAGVCEFGDDPQRVDCKVVDISNSGAQLACDEADKMPEYFRLYILPLSMVLDCRVMWRKENRMGVYFLAVVEDV